MNDIFARFNQKLSQSAEANDLSFTRESDESSTGDSDAANNIYLSNGKKSGLGDKQTTKLVVAPHKKRESYALHGLSQLDPSVKQEAFTTIKKHQTTIKADMKRYESQLKYRQDEARRDRKHEIKLQKSMQKPLRERLLHLPQAITRLGLQFRIWRDQ